MKKFIRTISVFLGVILLLISFFVGYNRETKIDSNNEKDIESVNIELELGFEPTDLGKEMEFWLLMKLK